MERALRAGDRLGGHLVQGHVDAIGRLRERHDSAEETVLDIGIESGEDFRVIAKGSVTLNGVSLTVVEAAPDRFTVALIPHTLAMTDLGDLAVGARVNLEMDPIGKWITTLVADSPWGR